jgi:hypothetical protein
MPPPPSRRYATPASEFGIAKPVNEWFDFAAAGSPQTGPSFSRGLDDADTRATQRELEQLKLQRELRSERALDNFLTQAAGQNPRGLMQLIQDSPDLLTNEQAPGIQSYVQSQLERQKAMRAEKEPFSTKVLAPSIVKNLTADQQVKFYRNVNSGMPVADAFDATMEQDRMEKLQMKAAENDLMMQRLGASRSRTGTGTSSASRFKQDDLEKADNYLLNLEEQGIAKDDQRYVRALARRDAIEMALDEDIFGPAVVKEQPAPGSAEAVEIERLAKEKADLEKKTPTSAAAPTALSPFEQQMQASRTGSEAQKLALNQAWTGAKDETMTGLLPDSNIQPQRLVSLAQQAALGNPLTGVTPQEKQLAERISQFALRAAEGKQIQVGTEAGEGGVVPVLQSPGFALLEQFGMDPNETVTISGAGMMGGDKEMKAWEVMDLRLKEIAQPFLQKRKEAGQMTPETQSAYERAKAKAAGLPTPNP